MPLFHPRVIAKHVKHLEDIPQHHADALSRWAENLERGIYDRETQNDAEFIQRILIDVLGYVGSSNGQKWTVAKNQPVGKGNVDVALGGFTANSASIIAPLELKGAKTRDLDAIMAGRNKTPVQQAWEYAMDAKGAQWVLVSNYREIRLYAVGYGRKEYESFNLLDLKKPENYARFTLLLSAQNLLEGKTLSLLKESEKTEKDITDQLYSDYKILRRRLIDTIGDDNPQKDALDIIRYTQTILDRILFVAFAEDKGLLPDKTLEKAYETQNPFNPQPVWENFKGLFQAINKGNAALSIPGYNGGLFADDVDLNNLNISNELCEGFKKIGEYDFDSDVSVNILGHIFEQSITDLEELKAQAEAEAEGTETQFDKNKSKRKKDGIFYTPAYITRYIVEQAVGGWLADRRKEIGFDALPVLTDDDFASIKITGKRKIKYERNKNIAGHIAAWEAYKAALSQIKVLDPACGSGAFLNEVFDYLKKEGQTINNELARLKGEQTDLFRWDTHILANNIYGVDLNRESVEITKLSLWLKTANRNEKLTYLENNIKVGNSLIDDPAIAGDLAFDWHKEFADIMKAGGFDVIIGNPPYAGIELILWDDRRWFEKNYSCAVGRFDLYSLFLEQGSKLSKKRGYISLIIPNKYLRNTQFSASRKLLLSKYSVSVTVIEEFVFSDANVESVIVCCHDAENKMYSCNFLNNDEFGPWAVPVEEILNSENQIFVSNKEESESIISKIDASTKNLSDIADIKDGIVAGQIKDILFLDLAIDEDSKPLLFGKDINRYYLGKASMYVNYKPEAMMAEEIKRQEGKRPGLWLRNKNIFEREKILTRFVASKIVATYDNENNYYSHTLHSTHITDKKFSYFYVLCLMNSKLYEYYYKRKNTKSGKLFPQVRIAFLKTLPIKDISENEQAPFIALARKAFDASRAYFAVCDNFIKLFKADFNIDKVGQNLEEWYDLKFGSFIKEVEKRIKPNKVSLSQKSEWMKYFEIEKAKAVALKAEIDRLDEEIDHMVYALYDLTADEISAIEAL